MSFRIRGFLIHLLASAILVSIASYIVFSIWYPSPLGQAIGVTSIVLILLGVDVVAGPLLTLAVCKEGKKSLKFDLSVIVLIQLCAFIYGIHILAQGRPAWIAFYENEFQVVRAYEADNKYRDKANPEYQTLSLTGPRWVAVRPPKDDEKKYLFGGLQEGVIFVERADFYEPIANQANMIKAKSIDISRLNQHNDPEQVKTLISRWPEADAFLPLITQEKDLTVLIKRATGEVVALVDLRLHVY